MQPRRPGGVEHVPSALESLAAFIGDPALATHARKREERLRLHIADTLGMILQGASLADARAAMALGSPLIGWCASARLTEADDIHLTSCATPGSVAVSVALHLAAGGVFEVWGDFATAVFAGYETLIRVGYAIDGPRILSRGIWPTLAAAPMGAAAAASRAWKLTASQTAGALATALAASTGVAPPAMMANSSRCILLGSAAAGGLLAAEAAKQGAYGDVNLLKGGRIAGLRVSSRRLLHGLGKHFFFDETGLKPYPVARQALAAVEACRRLACRDTRGISAITIRVPSAQARVIDQPGWPLNRMQSIANVRYQAALALLAPERLLEFHRTPPFDTKALRTLAGKIRVRPDPELESLYPGAWPARVIIERTGNRQFALMEAPKGDARNPMEWKDVLSKAASFRAVLEPVRDCDWYSSIPRVILDCLAQIRPHSGDICYPSVT